MIICELAWTYCRESAMVGPSQEAFRCLLWGNILSKSVLCGIVVKYDYLRACLNLRYCRENAMVGGWWWTHIISCIRAAESDGYHDEAAVSFWQGKTEMQQLIMWQVDRQSSHECLLVGELRILGVKKQSAAMFQWCWKSSPLIVEVCCFDATMELLLLDSHGQYNN